jgi:hypothetical protein
MAEKTIAFRQPKGWNLKKIGHTLELNTSELIVSALREYFKKRGIEIES